VAVYPSRSIRPIPSFMFSVPDGWILDEGPDSLAVVRTPEAVDGFLPNAILGHDRVPRSVDLQRAAEVTWAKLVKQRPDAEVKTEKVANFDGLLVYLRGVEMPSPNDGRQLGQLHALFFAPALEVGKTTDLFQWVCTSLVDQQERVGHAFVELIASFRFT